MEISRQEYKSDKVRNNLKDSEFYAEEEMIEIIPKFQSDQMEFISGNYGPFLAQTPISVPIWLALSLHKQMLCEVLAPTFLTTASLLAHRDAEKNSPVTTLQPLHYRFFEIARIFLKRFSNDIPQSQEVKALVKDIEQLRAYKLRHGLKAVSALQASSPGEHVRFVNLKNATGIELEQLRATLLCPLDEFAKLSPDDKTPTPATSQEEQMDEDEEEQGLDFSAPMNE